MGKHSLYQCETVTNKWVLIFVTDIITVPNSASPKIETFGEVFSTRSTLLTPNAVNFRVMILMLRWRMHQEGRDWRDIRQAAYRQSRITFDVSIGNYLTLILPRSRTGTR